MHLPNQKVSNLPNSSTHDGASGFDRRSILLKGDTPMKYVIERQYLLPVYQHLVVEADNVEDACRQAIEHDDWESAKEDFDNARATTIIAIRPVPDDVADDDIDASAVLYGEGAGPSLPVPEEYSEEPEAVSLAPPHGARFRDALAIVDPGGRNPIGIAQGILDGCREIRAHEPGKTAADDPAIRLMAYQLATVCQVAGYALERFISDEAACKDRLAELGLKPRGAG
jgi:hypothetical protein